MKFRHGIRGQRLTEHSSKKVEPFLRPMSTDGFGANRVGPDVRRGIDYRADAAGVRPLAAGFIQSSAFLLRVRRLVHVQVGVQFQKRLLQRGVTREMATRIRGRGQVGKITQIVGKTAVWLD